MVLASVGATSGRQSMHVQTFGITRLRSLASEFVNNVDVKVFHLRCSTISPILSKVKHGENALWIQLEKILKIKYLKEKCLNSISFLPSKKYLKRLAWCTPPLELRHCFVRVAAKDVLLRAHVILHAVLAERTGLDETWWDVHTVKIVVTFRTNLDPQPRPKKIQLTGQFFKLFCPKLCDHGLIHR